MWSRREGAEHLPPLLLFLFACTAYCVTVSTHYHGGDHGIFASVFAKGGYGHAPGYPLYSMYLRALSWIPATSPAQGAGFATAILGALSISVFYLACRAWGLSSWSAALGAVVLLIDRHMWFIHSQSEVFALNHLFAGALVWLSAPQGRVRGSRRIALLGLLAGLGVSHHHSIVLLAPIGFYGVWLGLRESEHQLKSLALGLATLAIGLTPYGYLVIVARTSPESLFWGDASTFDGLVHTFLRRDYGTFKVSTGETPLEPLNQIVFLFRSLAEDTLYLPVLLGVFGIAHRCVAWVRSRDTEGSGWLLLLVSLMLVGPLFVSLLHLPNEGVAAQVLRKFHLLFDYMFAFFLVTGADQLVRYLKRPGPRWGLLTGLLMLGSLNAYSYCMQLQAPTVQSYLEWTLETMPEDAVIIGTGDEYYIGFQYLQQALNQRPDVQYISAGLVGARWYRERLEEQLGTDVTFRGNEDLLLLIDTLNAQGRPIYLMNAFDEALLPRPNYPFVTTIHLASPGEHVSPPSELFDQNRALLATCKLELDPNAPKMAWSRTVLNNGAAIWYSLADALEQTGDPVRAAVARNVAKTMAPWTEDP